LNIAPWEVDFEVLESNTILNTHFTSENHKLIDKEAFQKTINEVIAEPKNWSLFRWFYPISFFLQVYALLAVLFVTGFLARFRYSKEFVDSNEFRQALGYCSAAIVVSMFYSLMRIGFSYQKLNYYPVESIPGSDYVILGLFVVALILVTVCFWLWLGEHIAGVLTLVTGGVGIVGAWKYENVLGVITTVPLTYRQRITDLG